MRSLPPVVAILLGPFEVWWTPYAPKDLERKSKCLAMFQTRSDAERWLEWRARETDNSVTFYTIKSSEPTENEYGEVAP